MDVYKAPNIKKLLSKDILEKLLPGTNDIKINQLETKGLSGSSMYKITVRSDNEKKDLYLKVNNLKKDWVAKRSNDKGRELTIFKDNIYSKVQEFIEGIYIAYYQGENYYAILMNDMSEYTEIYDDPLINFLYLDNLAKFHSKFKEYDLQRYKELLDVDGYDKFLFIKDSDPMNDIEIQSKNGWEKLKEILGKDLTLKFENLKEIEYNLPNYPKTFLHGDYRPDNTLYINDKDIRIIDWANSGCGPCTLDLFWYLMTSVDNNIDKTILINHYKESLEKYIGYKFTNKTWDTLLRVGILYSSKMFLSNIVDNTDYKDKLSVLNTYWWIDNLKAAL